MKKLLLMSTMAASITFSASAQKLNSSKVPAAVKASFVKAYPGVVAKWEKENGMYEVNFKQNGNIMSASYKANGTMTESETDLKISALPATVLAYVKEHYKGQAIKEGARITNADGSVNYEAEVGGKDVIFDANGKFIKEVKE